jgi:hypothetical protein
LFLQHSGEVELDEINEYLRGIGLRPVSPRMLVHYRRLYEHGYRSYIPINRFDIARAGDHAWSEELRARYPEIRRSFPAEITWEGGTYDATVETLGIATATVVTEPTPPAGNVPCFASHEDRDF